jgi:hypothetical protein
MLDDEFKVWTNYKEEPCLPCCALYEQADLLERLATCGSRQPIIQDVLDLLELVYSVECDPL